MGQVREGGRKEERKRESKKKKRRMYTKVVYTSYFKWCTKRSIIEWHTHDVI